MKNTFISKKNTKTDNKPSVISVKEFQRNNVITALMMLFIITMTFWLGMQFENSRKSNEFADFIEVKETIKTHYNLTEYDEETAMNNAIAAYVSSIGDKYAFYLAPEKHDLLVQQNNGNYLGIGISYTIDENKNAIISEVVKDGPADKAGIKVNDILIKINNIIVSEYEGNSIMRDLNIKNGDTVTTVVKRENKEIEFNIKIETITKDLATLFYHDNIAHIYLSTFSETSATQLTTIITEINNNEKCEGIILDLRDNGGGLLTSLQKIAGFFIEDKEIATFDYKEMLDETIKAIKSETYTNLPLVVLVNENSASASECLIGALQYYDRAEIIGTKTFGKGIGQSTIICKNGNYLKFTTSKYYLPSGECIHEKGIEPDINVDLPENVKNGDVALTVETDTQLAEALNFFKK